MNPVSLCVLLTGHILKQACASDPSTVREIVSSQMSISPYQLRKRKYQKVGGKYRVRKGTDKSGKRVEHMSD